MIDLLTMLAVLTQFSFNLPTTVAGLVVLTVALLIVWVVVSVPVYFAGKLVTEGKSGLGDAMGATLGGGLGYFIVLWGVSFFLGTLLGPTAIVFAFILALLVWLAVFKASFETGWLGVLGIVILSWVILFVLDVFLVSAFGVGFPKFYPF
ncbi:MAG: hypothetical protein OK441_02450 [Thaumarchaeota archaeon]|nr:hypothetical protein [Nitrososphaerota archaeon]